jgi:hypothetical protein
MQVTVKATPAGAIGAVSAPSAIVGGNPTPAMGVNRGGGVGDLVDASNSTTLALA